MKLEDLIKYLPWNPHELKKIHFLFNQYKITEQAIIEMIAKKTITSKFTGPNENGKYLCATYFDEMPVAFKEPDKLVGDTIFFDEVIFDLSAIHELVVQVIRDYMEHHMYPMHDFTIIIDRRLQQAVVRGKLPETQYMFDMKPYFSIIYCPNISGVTVIP